MKERRVKMRKFDFRNIMARAWEILRKEKGVRTMSEALHRAWISEKAIPENARRIEEAKKLAGVSEEVKTWFGWKTEGFEVNHGSKALFGVQLIYGSKGDGAVYKASFFGASQVHALA